MTMRSFGEETGHRFNAMRQAMDERGQRDRELSERWFVEPAVVYEYDAATERASLVLKLEPDSVPIQGVPVMYPGHCHVELKSIKAKDRVPDEGLLIWPRSDASRAYANPGQQAPASPDKNTGQGPVFLPLIPILSQAPFNSKSGFGLFWDKQGNLTIRAKSVNAIKTGSTGSNLAGVARQGDAGDGLGGGIAGGSTFFRSE